MLFRHTLITGLLYVLLSGSAWAQRNNKLLIDSAFILKTKVVLLKEPN
jgi:hypothetical protein